MWGNLKNGDGCNSFLQEQEVIVPRKKRNKERIYLWGEGYTHYIDT